jgi:glucosamine-6-phosphate deaminase
MTIRILPDASAASRAAAELLSLWLTAAGVTTLVAAAGNSPRELYRLVAGRGLALDRLHVFALDEYVGVPPEDSRTCANLLRRELAVAWGIPEGRYHSLSSRPDQAAASLRDHEQRLDHLGGIDVLVLGLGRNGHLGFNEPGSAPDCPGRVLELEPVSVEANARWFGGEYAPDRGVTLGLRDLLAARRVLVVAFGAEKAAAVRRAVVDPPAPECPASWLQGHREAFWFLDDAAAAHLPAGRRDR